MPQIILNERTASLLTNFSGDFQQVCGKMDTNTVRRAMVCDVYFSFPTIL